MIGWSENRWTPGGSSEKPHTHQQRRQDHQDEESPQSCKQCNTFNFSKEGPPLNALFSAAAFSVEDLAQFKTSGFSLCQVHGTRNCLCQHWPIPGWASYAGIVQKINFFLLLDKTVVINFAVQLSRDRSVWSMSKDIIRNLVSGVSVNIVKPLLVSEVRRIMPTAAGLPLELSLLTAAVTAANIRSRNLYS